jgi:AraC family transcriptional regulator
MNRAVDYIENNLCGGIDLEIIAKITYQSATSFQRTFSTVTEMSVSEYIRKRRMSLAALELKSSDAKVIDTSLKYGYDSPEAFARAFKEVFGISPSAARKEGVALKMFPRISFQMTLKGEVVMNYEQENSAVKLTNLYHEHMPAFRFIGKRYTSADLGADGLLNDRWNEWFQNGWFNLLGSLPSLPGYEGIAHTGYHKEAETTFWIGMMFTKDTPVPEGFDAADLPAGDMAVCWLHGYRETGELFTPAVRSLCLRRIREAGYAMKVDSDGEPFKWTFERYHNRRFFMPDDEGRITMDYCVYVAEQETAVAEASAGEPEGRACREADPADQPFRGQEQPVKAPSPQIQIAGLAPYWTDVENNLLLCAMTTMFLKLNNCEESTPFFCARNDRICNGCGDCGDMSKRSNLAKHHLYLYHHLLTVTGVSLMWGDPNEAGEYDLKYIKGITPPLAEDRLDFAMKAEGFEYIKLDKMTGEREIFRQITESIRDGKPVLMKLGDGPEWCVATGFDRETGALYGLDAKDHPVYRAAEKRSYTEDGIFAITDWFKNFRKAVIVTGRTQPIDFNGLLARITGRLNHPERGVLEAMIPQMIDAVSVENVRSVAGYLNSIAGYVVEARWHGAECFGSLLLSKTEDETARATLRECMELYFNTHDTCWQIWGQMGIGPHTNYKLPSGISQMMLVKERREKLKELFEHVFGNDRAVLEKLRGLIK